MGKTTTAVNLATALASTERVLLIDLDPQGNASTGLGSPRAQRGAGTYALLTGQKTLAEVIVHVTYSMLNFSIRDGQSHPDAVVQLKLMLTHYLLAAEAEAQRRRAM